MTDWLGMTARPEAPRPKLRAAVLARARGAGRRERWSAGRTLAAAAVLVVVVGAWWAGASLRRQHGRRWHQRGQLVRRLLDRSAKQSPHRCQRLRGRRTQ